MNIFMCTYIFSRMLCKPRLIPDPGYLRNEKTRESGGWKYAPVATYFFGVSDLAALMMFVSCCFLVSLNFVTKLGA